MEHRIAEPSPSVAPARDTAQVGWRDLREWIALIVVSAVVTVAVITLFMSIQRVGPFRTALIMNLEPLGATILSAPLLGEVITPLQGLGGVIMLAALVAFQLRR